MDAYDVAVVGCGPVGLALARLLSSQGLRVAAIDPNRIVCHHPRATHLDDETMRTLQTLGAADMEPRFLRQAGWTLQRPDGEPFLEFATPREESDQGWRTDYQFHQPDFESRLRGLLASDPNVDLWFGWTVTALDPDSSAVTVTVADGSAHQVRVLSAAYVVGCDGANSFVRQVMGAVVEDLQGTQRSLIVDIHPFQHPPALPPTAGFILCQGRRPVTYVPIFPPMLRFEFMLLPEDDATELERPQSVYDELSRWIEPGGYRIMRTGTYEWHARLVHGWRAGRLLLAGDAAHEMPPMLGQGMCSGLRDAANLAWKLAAVVHGTGAESLLDTYESERAAHVRPYIVESARQANLIESFGSAEHHPDAAGPQTLEPQALEPQTLEPQTLEPQTLEPQTLEPQTLEPQTLEPFRPPLGPGLAGGAGSAVGHLSPQPRSGDGARLDDITGYNFAVVGHRAVIEAVSDQTVDLWRRLGIAVVTDTGPAVDAWLAANSATAAVIRPDRYTFALATDATELETATATLARNFRNFRSFSTGRVSA